MFDGTNLARGITPYKSAVGSYKRKSKLTNRNPNLKDDQRLRLEEMTLLSSSRVPLEHCFVYGRFL